MVTYRDLILHCNITSRSTTQTTLRPQIDENLITRVIRASVPQREGEGEFGLGARSEVDIGCFASAHRKVIDGVEDLYRVWPG